MKRSLFESPKMAILIAIFCNILWGTALPVIKVSFKLFAIGDATSDKILFAGIRFFISGLMLVAYHRFSTKKMPTISKPNYLWVLALALVQTTAQYFFAYIGVSNTTGAAATIFSSISACYAVVLAHFFFTNDKLNTQKVVGSIVCVFGIFVSTLGEGTITFSLNGEGMLLISSFALPWERCSTRGSPKLTVRWQLPPIALHSGAWYSSSSELEAVEAWRSSPSQVFWCWVIFPCSQLWPLPSGLRSSNSTPWER